MGGLRWATIFLGALLVLGTTSSAAPIKAEGGNYTSSSSGSISIVETASTGQIEGLDFPTITYGTQIIGPTTSAEEEEPAPETTSADDYLEPTSTSSLSDPVTTEEPTTTEELATTEMPTTSEPVTTEMPTTPEPAPSEESTLITTASETSTTTTSDEAVSTSEVLYDPTMATTSDEPGITSTDAEITSTILPTEESTISYTTSEAAELPSGQFTESGFKTIDRPTTSTAQYEKSSSTGEPSTSTPSTTSEGGLSTDPFTESGFKTIYSPTPSETMSETKSVEPVQTSTEEAYPTGLCGGLNQPDCAPETSAAQTSSILTTSADAGITTTEAPTDLCGGLNQPDCAAETTSETTSESPVPTTSSTTKAPRRKTSVTTSSSSEETTVYSTVYLTSSEIISSRTTTEYNTVVAPPPPPPSESSSSEAQTITSTAEYVASTTEASDPIQIPSQGGSGGPDIMLPSSTLDPANPYPSTDGAPAPVPTTEQSPVQTEVVPEPTEYISTGNPGPAPDLNVPSTASNSLGTAPVDGDQEPATSTSELSTVFITETSATIIATETSTTLVSLTTPIPEPSTVVVTQTTVVTVGTDTSTAIVTLSTTATPEPSTVFVTQTSLITIGTDTSTAVVTLSTNPVEITPTVTVEPTTLFVTLPPETVTVYPSATSDTPEISASAPASFQTTTTPGSPPNLIITSLESSSSYGPAPTDVEVTSPSSSGKTPVVTSRPTPVTTELISYKSTIVEYVTVTNTKQLVVTQTSTVVALPAPSTEEAKIPIPTDAVTTVSETATVGSDSAPQTSSQEFGSIIRVTETVTYAEPILPSDPATAEGVTSPSQTKPGSPLRTGFLLIPTSEDGQLTPRGMSTTLSKAVKTLTDNEQYAPTAASRKLERDMIQLLEVRSAASQNLVRSRCALYLLAVAVIASLSLLL
ncbi:hypothetical protein TWF481_012300 [Arthrobotrys musiformis]|uniref:Uncharacterized protein n=1 Tax=Arthrobotrys musiformis TaxID=47236 RepID=A0AAV9VYQ4_9PEZI